MRQTCLLSLLLPPLAIAVAVTFAVVAYHCHCHPSFLPSGLLLLILSPWHHHCHLSLLSLLPADAVKAAAIAATVEMAHCCHHLLPPLMLPSLLLLPLRLLPPSLRQPLLSSRQTHLLLLLLLLSLLRLPSPLLQLLPVTATVTNRFRHQVCCS